MRETTNAVRSLELPRLFTLLAMRLIDVCRQSKWPERVAMFPLIGCSPATTALDMADDSASVAAAGATVMATPCGRPAMAVITLAAS